VVSITPRPRFTSGERAHGTHCTGGWVGPRAGLDPEVRGKILCLCQGSNPAVQSVVRHYTDWATPAPRLYHAINMTRPSNPPWGVYIRSSSCWTLPELLVQSWPKAVFRRTRPLDRQDYIKVLLFFFFAWLLSFTLTSEIENIYITVVRYERSDISSNRVISLNPQSINNPCSLISISIIINSFMTTFIKNCHFENIASFLLPFALKSPNPSCVTQKIIPIHFLLYHL
jgi:hypothetical protein